MDPSAEVRPASSLAQRAAKVRTMNKDHLRTTLEQARDIGNELRAAKEQCVREGKPWLSWLESAKTNPRTASRYMRIAEHWSLLVDYETLMTHGGVVEALNYLAGRFQDEEEIYGQPPPPPATSAPWPDNNRCRDCRTSGKNDAKCKKCRVLNTAQPPPNTSKPPPDPTWAENREAREEFGPGADDGELDTAAAALALALAAKVRAGMDRAAFRYCKTVAVSLGLEVVLQGEGANPAFGHPLIQQAYKQMGQAKWNLSNALKTVSEKAP